MYLQDIYLCASLIEFNGLSFRIGWERNKFVWNRSLPPHRLHNPHSNGILRYSICARYKSCNASETVKARNHCLTHIVGSVLILRHTSGVARIFRGHESWVVCGGGRGRGTGRVGANFKFQNEVFQVAENFILKNPSEVEGAHYTRGEKEEAGEAE